MLKLANSGAPGLPSFVALQRFLARAGSCRGAPARPGGPVPPMPRFVGRRRTSGGDTARAVQLQQASRLLGLGDAAG